MKILQALWEEYGHVSAERLLSGLGLELIHRALAGQRLSAPEITSRALDGSSIACRETVETFCAVLGSVAGNVALTLGATGGMYIGGGIVPRLGALFTGSRFRERFEGKGRLSLPGAHPDLADHGRISGAARGRGDAGRYHQHITITSTKETPWHKPHPMPHLTQPIDPTAHTAPGHRQQHRPAGHRHHPVLHVGPADLLNDVLIPHLKAIYTLSYVQAMLVQFCFFGAYFIVSVPAGALIRRIGYQKGAVTGLLIAAAGCALFYPASKSGYGLFLFAFFVLASGITILQVAANPYVTVLGPAGTASSRLTLTQAFNSLGTTIARYVGGILILSGLGGRRRQAGGDERRRAGGLPRPGSGQRAGALPGAGGGAGHPGRAVRAGPPAEDRPRRGNHGGGQRQGLGAGLPPPGAGRGRDLPVRGRRSQHRQLPGQLPGRAADRRPGAAVAAGTSACTGAARWSAASSALP
jgi:hypothetical protein